MRPTTKEGWAALAERLRASARDSLQRRDESFERSDTDGFLSQWASGLSADEARAKAEIADHEGLAEFTGLFSVAGERVPAVLIDGKYGPCWALCGPDGQFTGAFVKYVGEYGATPRKVANLAKKGYREAEEIAPAWAKLTGRGTGLSGNAWVTTYRLDGGYPGRPSRDEREAA